MSSFMTAPSQTIVLKLFLPRERRISGPKSGLEL
jgi:hypothetical protein